MKKLVFILFPFAAMADGPTTPYDRPPVMEPECRWLFLPCHRGFDYEEPEGDAPTVDEPPTVVCRNQEGPEC